MLCLSLWWKLCTPVCTFTESCLSLAGAFLRMISGLLLVWCPAVLYLWSPHCGDTEVVRGNAASSLDTSSCLFALYLSAQLRYFVLLRMLLPSGLICLVAWLG